MYYQANAVESLSARRAWIEIGHPTKEKPDQYVALRKESVDRNRQNYECFEWIKASLSARRAWIEIFVVITFSGFSNGRSPQGERG